MFITTHQKQFKIKIPKKKKCRILNESAYNLIVQQY